MSDYVDGFEDIFTRLAGMDATLTEDVQVAVFLESFGDKTRSTYGQVIASLQTVADTLTWEIATSRLLQEYEEKAFQGRSIEYRLPNTSHALQTRGLAQGSGSNQFRTSQNRNRKCYACGKDGHIARNCYSRNRGTLQRQDRNRANQDTNCGEGKANQARLIMARTEPYEKSAESNLVEFGADSGATHHKIRNKDRLSNAEHIPDREIVLGNDSTVTANIQGDLQLTIQMHASGELLQRSVTLTNVLYVPEIESNLVSLGALCDDDCVVRLGRNGSTAIREGLLCVQGLKKQGLYVIMAQVNRSSEALSAVSQPLALWHQRLAHASKDSVRRLYGSKSVTGLSVKSGPTSGRCVSCIDAKFFRRTAKFNPRRAHKVGQVVHSDVCGPMSVPSLGGSCYFTTFIDGHSGFLYVVAIKSKSDVAGAFRRFMQWCERRFDCSVKRLQSDGGGEYLHLMRFLDENGIEFRPSPPYSPNQNAIAERANRTIIEATRTLLRHDRLPRSFWAEAAPFSTHVRNIMFAPSHDDTTSHEIVYGVKPRMDHLRVFVCLCWVFIPEEKRKKLDSQAENGLLLYCFDNSQYKVWINDRKTVVVTRHVLFEENVFPGWDWFSDSDVKF